MCVWGGGGSGEGHLSGHLLIRIQGLFISSPRPNRERYCITALMGEASFKSIQLFNIYIYSWLPMRY